MTHAKVKRNSRAFWILNKMEACLGGDLHYKFHRDPKIIGSCHGLYVHVFNTLSYDFCKNCPTGYKDVDKVYFDVFKRVIIMYVYLYF